MTTPTRFLSGLTLQERRISSCQQQYSTAFDGSIARSASSISCTDICAPLSHLINQVQPSSCSFTSPAVAITHQSVLDAACRKLCSSGAQQHSTLQLEPLTKRPLTRRSSASASLGITSALEVRKKSGELVKSSLKLSAGTQSVMGWTKSLPSTPAIIKAVRFNPDLEEIKLFSLYSRPSTVARDAALAHLSEIDLEADDTLTYAPFFNSLGFRSLVDSSRIPTTHPASETACITNSNGDKPHDVLVLRLPNFPSKLAPLSRQRPIFLERIVLSEDLGSIQGVAQVSNLAFGKWVAVRYTMDQWTTVQEVSCVHQETIKNGQADCFGFTIRLSELLDWSRSRTPKSVDLCLRYSTLGQEFWDNNGGANYRLEFIMRPEVTLKHQSEPHASSRTTRTTYVQEEKQSVSMNSSLVKAQMSPNGPTRPSRTNQSSARYTFKDALRYSRIKSSFSPPRPDAMTDYFSRRPSYSASPTSSMWSNELKKLDSQSAKSRIGDDVHAPMGELSDPATVTTSFNSVRSWGSGLASRSGNKVCVLLLSIHDSSGHILTSLLVQQPYVVSNQDPEEVKIDFNGPTLEASKVGRQQNAIRQKTANTSTNNATNTSLEPTQIPGTISLNSLPQITVLCPSSQSMTSPSSPPQSTLSLGSFDSLTSSPLSSVSPSPYDTGVAPWVSSVSVELASLP